MKKVTKSLLATAILTSLFSNPALAQEYRFVVNHQLALSGDGGGGGGSETPSEPITTDPGDPTVWGQFATDHGLSRMSGSSFAEMYINNVSGAELPSENYPETTVGNVNIDTSDLTNVGSLRSITTITDLYSSLYVLPNFRIVSNPSLGDLNGFSNMTGAVDSVNIQSNDSLASISGVSGLTLTANNPATVQISGNSSLLSIDGIEGLLATKNSYDKPAIKGLVVKNNISLTDNSALSALDPYPQNITNDFDLSGNAFADISSLGHITNLRTTLNLSGNQIVDPSPLDGINARLINLSNNQITKTNDASTMSFSYTTNAIDYSYNPIDDISGLGGYTDSEKIILDDRAFTVKMPTSSHMCQLNGSAYNFEAVLEKTGGLGTFAYSEVCGD